ncbi:class I SAM-dependent methyltransferase [Cytophagaceae bacterium ABcell3]|nr:class I SAM-dependent methyltransferase [Cytophagaceae bacterium ABcell3]
MQIQEKEWFTDWFNSPYYHILYKNRDKKEAALFIDNLCGYLQLKNGQKILDVACGKGRHSIYLNDKGYDVTGIDLSEKSIRQAQKAENNSLRFKVCDMRQLNAKEAYDVALNLFTSFGYFDKEEDNLTTIKNLYQSLKPGGKLVIDFMNARKVIDSLVSGECRTIENIDFCISRRVENNFIIKEISFYVNENKHIYEERVQALFYEDFIKYFNFVGFSPVAIFGDYNLGPYVPTKSDRMIWVVEKK